jgi:hypothetical protein
MEERWSRRADRIEQGDSPVFSIPVLAALAHCLLSGVARCPVVPNRVARAGEPFLVATKFLKRLGGKKLRAISGWVTEWFQEAGCNKNWNFVQFEAKKPGCLGRIEARGSNLPTEEFGLF